MADFEITPDIAIVDPDLAETMPQKLVAHIGMDAVADACTGSNPRQISVEELEKLLKCCYYDMEVDF